MVLAAPQLFSRLTVRRVSDSTHVWMVGFLIEQMALEMSVMEEDDDPRPDLPKEKIMAVFSELKTGFKYEDRFKDEVILHRGLRSVMSKYPDFKFPYNCGQYAGEFLESLYLQKGVVEPLARDRLGSWRGPLDVKIRATAKRHGKEKEILSYLRRVMAGELSRYLRLKYLARQEERGEEMYYVEYDNYQEACEENRLWLADAYQEASEMCERAGVIEQMEEYRSLSQRLSKDDLRESLPKAEKTKMDEALFWSILRDTWESSSLAAERTVALGECLRRYNTTAIRKFASLYKRSIKKLNDYRAWDFVYIMEGGCGDDSFMDFKETIVFLGHPELIDLVLERPVEAAELLSTIPNVDLKEEYGLSSVIDFACLARSGKTIEWAEPGEPRGKMLDEEEIYAQYPELSQWVDKHGYLSQ